MNELLAIYQKNYLLRLHAVYIAISMILWQWLLNHYVSGVMHRIMSHITV